MKKILLLLPCIICLCSCSNVSKSISQDSSYSVLKEKEYIGWKDLLKQNEDKYYGYVYSETCHYCNMLKKDIDRFFYCGNEKIYFILHSKDIPIGTKYGDFSGEIDINKLYILGTPTMFIIENKTVVDCLTGYNKIKSYLDN